MPKDAGGIYWVKNSTDDRVTNDGGISRLSFPCQNVYLQCCYALKRQDFCGEMVVIIMRKLRIHLNVKFSCLECINYFITITVGSQSSKYIGTEG